MSDSELRAALRSLDRDDVPFLLDLLERISGVKWREATEDIPSIEDVLTGAFYITIGEMMTATYRGKRAACPNSPYAMRHLAKRLRDQL